MCAPQETSTFSFSETVSFMDLGIIVRLGWLASESCPCLLSTRIINMHHCIWVLVSKSSSHGECSTHFTVSAPPQTLLWSDHLSFGRHRKGGSSLQTGVTTDELSQPEGLGETETPVERSLSKGIEREQTLQVSGFCKVTIFSQILD